MSYAIDGTAVFTGALGFGLALAWNDAAAVAVREARVPHGELARALVVTAAVLLVLAAARWAGPGVVDRMGSPAGGPGPAGKGTPPSGHRYIVASAAI